MLVKFRKMLSDLEVLLEELRNYEYIKDGKGRLFV